MRKTEAVERVVQAGIAFGSSADRVTDAAARTLGVNRTDVRVMGVIRAHEQLTIGELAPRTGLSPAAATKIAQRLVAAGYATLATNPQDGRSRLIRLTDHAYSRLREVYDGMLEQGRIWLTGRTMAELALLEEFLGHAEELQIDLARSLTRWDT